MTLSPWIIYLWGIADGIKGVTGVGAALLIIATFIFVLIKILEDEDNALKAAIASAMLAVVLALFSALTPSSKTIAVMVVAPAIVNSEPIQKDLPELYKAAKDALMSTLTK